MNPTKPVAAALNALSHKFGYDSPAARILGAGAQRIIELEAALAGLLEAGGYVALNSVGDVRMQGKLIKAREVAAALLEPALLSLPPTSAADRRKARLAREVHEQRIWIRECGGTEAGYIEHYGNPGLEHCYGNGGSAIYKADLGYLNELEREAGFPVTSFVGVQQ